MTKKEIIRVAYEQARAVDITLITGKSVRCIILDYDWDCALGLEYLDLQTKQNSYNKMRYADIADIEFIDEQPEGEQSGATADNRRNEQTNSRID